MASPPTLAQALIETLAARGTRRLFGVPGGGSSLALIEAARAAGLDFVLTATETGAGLMAAVTAELSRAPGAVLTGVGPGAASAVNGVAYAHLEKSPLVLLSDVGDTDHDGPAPLHQRFDQPALYGPLTRWSGRLRPDQADVTLGEILAALSGPPPGPVQIDVSARDAESPAARPTPPPADRAMVDEAALTAVQAAFGAARRPLLLVGLEARDPAVATALGALMATLGAPALTTYKAKGVVADDRAGLIGHLTGAAGEAEILQASDCLLAIGLDPIELIPGPWPARAPLLDLAAAPRPEPGPVPPLASAAGDLARMVGTLAAAATRSDWPAGEIAELKARLAARLARGQTSDLSPAAMIARARRAAPAETRLTVDAGAHMFSTLATWRARAPFDVLKSNGLSTMGFAVPAAIAGALAEPGRPHLAATGDGGLVMGLGELATLHRLALPVVVLVLNDAALSLIDVKQRRRQLPRAGVAYPRVDFAAVARGLGLQAWSVATPEALGPALDAAFAAAAPALVDVRIDASGYAEQVAALRG